MHSPQTVEYRRVTRTVTGGVRHEKREMICVDSWRDLASLYWSAWRPVTEATYRRAKRNGYRCREEIDRTPLARVLDMEVLRHGRRRVGFAQKR